MNNAILKIGHETGIIIGETKIGEAVVDELITPITAEVGPIITVETRERESL
jgi:hypothetical protein